ncbi:SOS response-associated peptidase [Gillisia sp. CAL575]|uniref:SOS response-associated peptidase n=1 Tax=Gillisia sp. CAL575 TaxID=985255 RepID=UPI0003AA3105|nr:SOS response-associated peptidase [Gillisia sp. CAL575]
MCYETTSTKKAKQIEKHFKADFEISDEYEPYFHKSGFSYSNLQIIKMDEAEKIYPASWGLVPDWGTKNIEAFRKKYNTLNTKSETLFSGLSKGSALNKRCIILVDGFFEPHKQGGVSIPNFCYIPSKEYDDGKDLLAFAGIYSEIDKSSDSYTCSILTTAANDFFEKVHNVKKRMPLVLAKELYSEWFNDGLSKENIIELMKNGFTSKEFSAHPVSRDLYKRGLNTNKEYIIEPIDKATLF